MREIKFRAWDNNLNQMYEIVSINFDLQFIHLDPDYCHKVKIKDIELMEYTGLKDKNGVEIYEGDIIRGDRYPFWDKREPNYVAVVEWIFAGFQYVYYCINPKKRGISDGINNILESGEDFEIIGNIYENPELVDK